MKDRFQPFIDKGVLSEQNVAKLIDSITEFDELETRYIIVATGSVYDSSFPSVSWSSIDSMVTTLSELGDNDGVMLQAISIDPGKPFARMGWTAKAYGDGSIEATDRHECVFWPTITGHRTFGHIVDSNSPWNGHGATVSVHFSDESQEHAIHLARQQLAEHNAKKEASV